MKFEFSIKTKGMEEFIGHFLDSIGNTDWCMGGGVLIVSGFHTLEEARELSDDMEIILKTKAVFNSYDENGEDIYEMM